MSTTSYRSARALYPHRPDLWEPDYFYEPPPVPTDHPELDLWGVERVWQENEAEDKGAGAARISNLRSRFSVPPSEIIQDPLPARMLNEFVYCPRLFYYEQVEGVFVSNADTERGSAIHEKVDRGKGALPKAKKAPGIAPHDEPSSEADPGLADLKTQAAEDSAPKEETIHSRSAMLSSTRLGVVAKMDLIEVKMLVMENAGWQTPAAEARPDGDQTPKPSLTAVAASKRTSKEARDSSEQTDLFADGSVCKNAGPIVPDAAAGGLPPAPTVPAMQRVDLRKRVMQSVTPVDYKAGAPRRGEDQNELWDADKMQLGLQILILRDNGYICNEGVIYYRATKQRVPLRMTTEIEAWVIAQIAKARELAASPTIPPPLVNSPKCVRCSLAPVCLPDETRMLANDGGRTPPNAIFRAACTAPRSLAAPPTAAPRRLMAARDDERALYLNTQGHRVGIKSERLVIKDGDSVVDEIRLNDVTHVALFGNIQVSTQAVQELCEQEIPVAYFSMGGWFYGITRGHGLKNVHTRIRQFAAASNPLQCLAVAQKIVRAKIRNHRTLLMRLHTQPPSAAVAGLKEIAGRVTDARRLDELLGMEGAAAALYFQHFAGMIKVGDDDLEDDIPGLEMSAASQERRREYKETFTFDFTQRRRRPPTDAVNALLSFAYSLLAKDCTIAALAVGFDPYVGFYHQPRHGRPALALDLMEEFRPLVAESAVLTAINNRMVTAGHFVRAGDAVNLTQHGRKAFFHAYEQRMNALITHPVFDYKVSYRRVLELQARLLARWLTGEIPDYVPMVTR